MLTVRFWETVCGELPYWVCFHGKATKLLISHQQCISNAYQSILAFAASGTAERHRQRPIPSRCHTHGAGGLWGKRYGADNLDKYLFHTRPVHAACGNGSTDTDRPDCLKEVFGGSR
jgi:hypothetical protein